MRDVVFEEIFRYMQSNEDCYLLTADTGFGLLDKFFDSYPERIINVGIAEQLCIAMASGIACEGGTVICYGITNFMVHRCLEMIRNDLCLKPLHVIVIGTSTGYENSKLGPTHHVIDDIQIMSGFHNLTIYSPTGKNSAIQTIRKALNKESASYIRLCKSNLEDDGFELEGLKYVGKIPGSESVKTIACRGIGFKVLESLTTNDENISLLLFTELNPIPTQIIQGLKRLNSLYVWDDSSCKQLYKQLAYHLMIEGIYLKMKSIAPSEEYYHKASDDQEIYKQLGIDALKVKEAIK